MTALVGTRTYDLTGKVALVTGGSKGIGQGIAVELARAGADVAVLGRERAALDVTVSQLKRFKRRAIGISADVSQVNQIYSAVEQTVDKLGDLDILVNNAGTNLENLFKPSIDVTEKEWDWQLDVMLKGVFFGSQAAARHFMTKPVENHSRGKIVNLGSTYSYVAIPNYAAYCAAKGAILQLTKALATEWAKDGINVNAVGPTAVRTPASEHIFSDAERIAAFLQKVPANRVPTGADVGLATVFLCSEAASLIHGHMLMVDGGFTIV